MIQVRVLLSFGTLLMSVCLSFGQLKPLSLTEFMREIESINRTLSSPKRLQVDIRQQIRDESNGEVVYTGEGYFIRKDSNRLHSLLMGIETIQNSDYKVVIDTTSKTVVVSKNVDFTPMSDLKYMHSLLPKVKGLEVFGGTDSLGRKELIAIYPKNSLTKVKTLRIIVSKRGLLHTIQIGATSTIEGKKVNVTNTIVYSNYRLNKRISNREFRTTEIIKVEDNKMMLIGSFRTYQLVNMINQ